jgi:hypothetical protein
VLAAVLESVGEPECDWRQAVVALAQGGVVLDSWECIVLGTHLTNAELDGVERILPSIRAADWVRTRGATPGSTLAAENGESV